MSIIFMILYVLSYVSSMSKSYWLSHWSNQVILEKENAIKNKFFYLSIYALFGFLNRKSNYLFLIHCTSVLSFLNIFLALMTFIANLCFVWMFLIATRNLHNKMLYSVMRANLRFFDSTPTGRIVNRFTKDVEATEESIPSSVKSLIDCSLAIISTLIIICSSTPFFILALIPITVVYILVQV
jgi:ABC-type multidrug transport system fused ATPase/permease subunit